MKRFRFRLQRLERLRRMLRQRSEAALARSRGLLAERMDRCASLERTLSGVEGRWGELGREPADGAAWRETAQRLEHSRSLLAEAGSLERAARAEVGAAERELVERAREHRVLERLRERKKRRWLEEGAREEQRSLDELHLLATARKTGRDGNA